MFHSYQLDETLLERLWGLTEMFPDTLRSAAEVSAQCSLSFAKKAYRYCPDFICLILFSHNVSAFFLNFLFSCSFSRSALWIGTTSFMILVLPVVFETERLQLEQQQLQQQRQVMFSSCKMGIYYLILIHLNVQYYLKSC